jgi:intracellular sulfur oxidation DsrE/DsrF family protein
MTYHKMLFVCALASLASGGALAQWTAPQTPVIPEADGYILIPKAAERPRKDHVYKAIFEATQFPDHANQLLPALNNAGSELNALGVEGVPRENRKFVVVFHGNAMDGLLDDAHYKEKYGVRNPNLKVLSEFRREGVELYVCGQNLAMDKIDPATLTRDVTLASDALIVLMHFQNAGYAHLSF